MDTVKLAGPMLFLSTLSLRRATCASMRIGTGSNFDFYPRSPCGERHLRVLDGSKSSIISIHALLAESDYDTSSLMQCQAKFLSTLSLRRATARRASRQQPAGISIHALLAESDPSSTRKLTNMMISIHALLAESDMSCAWSASKLADFYPRSPCGERPILDNIQQSHIIFLSTLSLRRATVR